MSDIKDVKAAVADLKNRVAVLGVPGLPGDLYAALDEAIADFAPAKHRAEPKPEAEPKK